MQVEIRFSSSSIFKTVNIKKKDNFGSGSATLVFYTGMLKIATQKMLRKIAENMKKTNIKKLIFKYRIYFVKSNTGTLKQCCGARAGGAEIILDLEPEPKLHF